VSETWRCFVSVPIGAELRSSLADALVEWRTRPDLVALRWSDPGAWHVTLAFLGDTDPATIDDAAARLASLPDRHSSFELATGGLGGFRSAERARVAWYGVDDTQGRLGRLADDVGRAVDLEPDRKFTAHLTLGRAIGRPIDLRGWIREAVPPEGALLVDRLDLMRSHTDRGPAHYETLISVPLGVPRHE